LNERLSSVRTEAEQAIPQAMDLKSLEELRVRFLGKKGALTELLKELGAVPVAEKPAFGKACNELKGVLTTLLDERQATLEASAPVELPEGFDPTLPGRSRPVGHGHPLTTVMDEIVDIFRDFGFDVATGPDVETDHYNFQSLNFPDDHPARDSQDTFFLPDGNLLRTHTSPVQVRTMEKGKPPFKFVVPGRVYRHEAVDATHHHIFHQVEGFLVDEGIQFSHLKGVLDAFVKRFYGPEIKTRFRPSFFPFTEPSAEMDISCIFCDGKGCRICKQSGWVETLGCGMIHPNVLKNCNMDPEKWSGFAFGMGVERISMFKYRVDDIRHFYQNDLRFLSQFK
jgi:phenylalanyl-tRNA synthetase alpha chain